MTTPSYSQWRIPGSNGNGLTPANVQYRILCALATLATQTNPDGTVKGS